MVYGTLDLKIVEMIKDIQIQKSINNFGKQCKNKRICKHSLSNHIIQIDIEIISRVGNTVVKIGYCYVNDVLPLMKKAFNRHIFCIKIV